MGVSIFGKNNIKKSREDDPGSTGIDADKGIRTNGLGKKTDVDVGIDNPGTVADNPGIVADNPGIGTDNSDRVADNPGITTDNLGTGTDADIGKDDSGIVASNKAHCAFFFIFCYNLFLLASSFEWVTAFLLSFLLSLSLTILQLKLILSCSVTLMKRRAPSSMSPIEKMYTPSPNKVISEMSAVVRLL